MQALLVFGRAVWSLSQHRLMHIYYMVCLTLPKLCFKEGVEISHQLNTANNALQTTSSVTSTSFSIDWHCIQIY